MWNGVPSEMQKAYPVSVDSRSSHAGAVRLRVLAIDEEVPYPPNTGKRIRTWNLLKRLAKKHDITLLCYGDERGDEFDAVRESGIKLQLVPTLPELRGVALYSRLLLNTFSRFPYSVSKHYTRTFQQELDQLLSKREFDVLHCEWTPYARYAPTPARVATVLATHNIESQIWSRRAQQASSLFARVFFAMQAAKMARFERAVLPKMSVVTTVSGEDSSQASHWGTQNCMLVENGVDLQQFHPTGAGHADELLFVGSLDWFPNRDAIEYMVRDILPVLRREFRHCVLRVVGRRPPQDFLEQFSSEPGVAVIGEVSDVTPYYDRAGVVVVPLRIGGGSRIKILEALAAGKAVISTRVGAEGLAVSHGENIVLADSPAEFVEALSRMQSPEERLRIGMNGRELVERRYSWDGSAQALESAWQRAVEQRQHGGAR